MLIDLAKSGLEATSQQPIKVHDDGEIVGEFVADLLVKNQSGHPDAAWICRPRHFYLPTTIATGIVNKSIRS